MTARPAHVLSLLALVGAFVAFAGGASATTQATSVRFDATLRLTVVRDWSSTAVTTRDGKRVEIRRRGGQTITLRNARPARIAVVRTARGPTPVRYARSAIAGLAGVVARRGASQELVCDPTCTASAGAAACTLPPQRVRGLVARFYASRPHVLSFRPMRLRGAEFAQSCPPEPAVVRRERAGIDDAQGSVDEDDFFDSSLARLTLDGSYEATTTFTGAESGRVAQRIRWTLLLRRVASR